MVTEHTPDDLLALRTAAETAYLALARRRSVQRLSDADVAGGEFTGGASCLRFRDGRAPFAFLAVTAADFAAGLARLQRAGVNFAHVRYQPA